MMPWIVFSAVIAAVLLLDQVLMRLSHGRPHHRDHLVACAMTVLAALAFGVWLHLAWARGWINFNAAATGGGMQPRPFTAFLTGYSLELALSLDNLVMFLLVIRSFRLPSVSEYFVLLWAIMGSLVARGILIVSGLALIVKIHWVFYLMGVIVLVTAMFMMFEGQKGEQRLAAGLSRILRRWLPMTEEFSGNRLFVHLDGRRVATPLLLVMCMIGAVDVLFAFDSIPAIFGITTDPLIVVSSNVLAVLALHRLYFLMATQLQRLRYLETGLTIILLFIGVKMLLPLAGGLVGRTHVTISLSWSLGVMAVVLGIAIGASLLWPTTVDSK